MQLPVSLEYDLGADGWLAYLKMFGSQYSLPFWSRILRCWMWFTGMLLGLGCAVAGGYILIACYILVIIAWLVVSIRRDASVIPVQWQQRLVRLDITDDGMTEHDKEVQAFMPWSSMGCWKRIDSFLFVGLNNNLVVTIADRDASGQPIDLQKIANLLLEHGVKERK